MSILNKFRLARSNEVKFENKTFEGLHDSGGRTIDGLQFLECRWVGCSLSMRSSSSHGRTVVRNVEITDSQIQSCYIGAPIFENVTVSGLETGGLLQFFGAAFKHVTLKGKIGRLMPSSTVSPGDLSPKQQRDFDLLNDEFYRNVDWALDIKEAQVVEFDASRLRVPSSLIVRDKETQAVLKREKALLRTWTKLGIMDTEWAVGIELFLKTGAPDTVLVAPKRARNFKQLLAALNTLREAGVAEPE